MCEWVSKILLFKSTSAFFPAILLREHVIALSFFSLPLHCLSFFKLLFLAIPLLSSNFSDFWWDDEDICFTRPNNMSLLCLYLSLYISFLLFGHLFVFFDTQRQKALLYKSSTEHTICMRCKFGNFSSFVQCKHLPVYSLKRNNNGYRGVSMDILKSSAGLELKNNPSWIDR